MSENETPKSNETAADAATPSCCCSAKKCKLWIPLLIILILIAIGYAISQSELWQTYMAARRLHSSKPYLKALKAVQNDAKVIEKLGKPVTKGETLSGNLTDITCNLVFDIAGPNGTARVMANGRASEQKVWSFSQLEVTFTDGQRITVETEDEPGGLSKAKAFNPEDNPAEESGIEPPSELNFDIPTGN